MKLTKAQRQFYSENGYLVVEGLVSSEHLARLRTRIDEIQQAIVKPQTQGAADAPVRFLTEGGASSINKPALRKLTDLARNDDFFLSIASSREIVAIVAALTGGGDQIMLYSDQCFLKPAFCGSEKPLHQDNSYFKVTPHSAGVTCWMAIDHATVENGCMNYMPGSHKFGLVNHKEIKNTPHLVPDVDFKLPDERPVPIPSGACIFHHLLCMHSSKANQSPNPRRAWALHYANRVATGCVKPWEQMLPMAPRQHNPSEKHQGQAPPKILA